MRRKIIQQGNHSFTLTLPIQWIRDEGILEGQEVEIAQEGGQLVVSLPNQRKRIQKAVSFDISSLKGNVERTIKNLLNQSYRKGIDCISLRLKGKEQMDEVKSITRRILLGFDVVEESGNRCLVKSIAEPSSDNYDSILNKLFFMILDGGREIQAELLSGHARNLPKRVEIKGIFDNYTNFLRRIIIRDKIGGTHDSYAHFMIVSRLSLMGHSFYIMYFFLSRQKSFKLNKETMSIYAKVLDMVETLRQAYSERSLEKTHEVDVMKDKLLFGDIYTAFQRLKGPDSIVLYHLGEVVRLTHLTSTIIFSLLQPSGLEEQKKG